MSASSRRAASRPLPMIVIDSNEQSGATRPDSDDERELIGNVQEQYGEYCGRINASRCESHPFMRSIFMFQLFLGLFGTLVTVQSLFIFMSTDRTAMQIALFIIELLLAAVVAVAAHDVRMEEMLLRVRCSGYAEATRVTAHVPVSMGFFGVCVLAQLLANMVAARTGDLATWVHILLSLVCAGLVFAAMVAAQRHRNHYIVNDL